MIFPKRTQPVIRRYEHNPIITVENLPCESNSVFNSGCIKHDGRYIMMLRIEDIDGSQHFRMAYSPDGVHFDIDTEPVVIPDSDNMSHFELIRYDPRLTWFPEDKCFYICYAAHGTKGVRVGMMKTTDFKSFQRIGRDGYTSQPDNRNGVLFPEKVDGRYVRLDRPTVAYGQGGKGDMWISFSPDLVHWGDARIVAETRPERWDGHKVGAGHPPIRTDEGWLLVYHGVYERCNGLVYRAGAMLLDLEDPTKVVARGSGYVLSPKMDYERNGDVDNVIFVTGAVVEDDGSVKLYYGGADTVMCLGFSTVKELIAAAKDQI